MRFIDPGGVAEICPTPIFVRDPSRVDPTFVISSGGRSLRSDHRLPSEPPLVAHLRFRFCLCDIRNQPKPSLCPWSQICYSRPEYRGGILDRRKKAHRELHHSL